MKRKIVKQGAATLMVSLPSKWAKKFNLRKGGEVDIAIKSNTLIISPEPSKIKKEAEIRITSTEETSVRTLITNLYRIGYDRIKIYFNHLEVFEHIKNTVKNNLIGFEMIKEEKNYCIIENITEPTKEQFDNIFSKVFLNIDEIFVILERVLKKEKIYQDYKEVEQRVQQYDNFCRRIISKDLSGDLQLRWAFHMKLIHGQRELFLLIRYLIKNKISGSKDIFSFLNEVKKLFNLLKEAYHKEEVPLLEKIHEAEKILIYKKGYPLLKKEKEKIVIYHLMSAIRNFYLASSPLMGLKLAGRKN